MEPIIASLTGGTPDSETVCWVYSFKKHVSLYDLQYSMNLQDTAGQARTHTSIRKSSALLG